MSEDLSRALDQEFLHRVLEKALWEMETWPRESKTKPIKRWIRKNILKQRTAAPDRFSWQQGLPAEAVLEVLEADVRLEHSEGRQVLTEADRMECMRRVMAYYGKWMDLGQPMSTPDNAVHGLNLLKLYRMTGENRYADAAMNLADFLWEYPRTGMGVMLYRPWVQNDMYVDTLGMISAFLFAMSICTGMKHFGDMALLQIDSFLRYGIDPETGLPCQCYSADGSKRMGAVGWGRGTGWLVRALADSIRVLRDAESYETLFSYREEAEADTEEETSGTLDPALVAGWRRHLEAALEDLLQAVQPRFKEDGSCSWCLSEPEGTSDSSAAAIIADGMMLSEDPAVQAVSDRTCAWLIGCEQNGLILQGSGECAAFDVYSEVYASYPWTIGPALRLFARKLIS